MAEEPTYLIWGTYDTGKPRTRILMRGLRENGVRLLECHADVWGGIEDKTRLLWTSRAILLGLKWILSYPGLVFRYLTMPSHDVVIVGYLGHLDVLVLWPMAKLRRKIVVWDAFISLYNTIVEDRKLVRPGSLIARFLHAWEWLACRAADVVVIDTAAHAEYFRGRYRLPSRKVLPVFVGVEPESFPATPVAGVGRSGVRVLFFGQFIPLHGIGTILAAARLSEGTDVSWTLLGEGQDDKLLREEMDRRPFLNLKWDGWVPYDQLLARIAEADVCLGIFGATRKAAMVIPNKVFQVVASGKPLITRDSPAIRELFPAGSPGLFLVPPADPEAILEALELLRSELPSYAGRILHVDQFPRCTPRALGLDLIAGIDRIRGS